MIWLSHISSSKRYHRLLAGLAFACVLRGATVSGQVVLVNSDQPAVKAKHNYSGVVVWLQPVGPGSAHPDGSTPKPAVVDQRNKMFSPHVLAIEVGTAVDFPNSDPIFHNAFSNGDSQVFDLHLYAPQESHRVVFRRPGVAKVFCNVHESMSAFIAVLPTPYFAVTGADGGFAINVPAGRYRLGFWHERAQPALLAKVEQQVTVGDSNVALAKTQISEEGYSPTPHKDKWGLDYTGTNDENSYFPGGRR